MQLILTLRPPSKAALDIDRSGGHLTERVNDFETTGDIEIRIVPQSQGDGLRTWAD